MLSLRRDPSVGPEYGQEEECLAKGSGEHGGAYIVRLPCGPTEQYIRWGGLGQLGGTRDSASACRVGAAAGLGEPGV